jgi:uncharacterized protein (TIGR00369 family)
MLDHAVPEGFHPLNLAASGFISVNGPLYAFHDDGVLRVGMRVESRHCNPTGVCHGGMLATVADMVLGFGVAVQGGIDSFMPTINLTCDYIAPAPEGCWLEGTAEVVRTTRNLAFANIMLTADSTPCVRGNGILKIPSENPVGFSLKKIFSHL